MFFFSRDVIQQVLFVVDSSVNQDVESWIVRVDELDEKCSNEPSTLIIIVNFKGTVGCGGLGRL